MASVPKSSSKWVIRVFKEEAVGVSNQILKVALAMNSMEIPFWNLAQGNLTILIDI